MASNIPIKPLLNMAKDAALNKAAEITLFTASKSGLLHAGTEIVEHGVKHASHGKPFIKGGWIRNSLKNKSPLISNASEAVFNAGEKAGAYIKEPVLNTTGNLFEQLNKKVPNLLTFDEEHGIYLSNHAGSRLVGAGVVGAGLYTAATYHHAVEDQYSRDPQAQASIDKSLGAHGGMVIDGHRAARKRY